jgi:hypothetical protein
VIINITPVTSLPLLSGLNDKIPPQKADNNIPSQSPVADLSYLHKSFIKEENI